MASCPCYCRWTYTSHHGERIECIKLLPKWLRSERKSQVQGPGSVSNTTKEEKKRGEGREGEEREGRERGRGGERQEKEKRAGGKERKERKWRERKRREEIEDREAREETGILQSSSKPCSVSLGISSKRLCHLLVFPSWGPRIQNAGLGEYLRSKLEQLPRICSWTKEYLYKDF